MFKLVISDEEGKTTVVPLAHDQVTIGRREGNTVRLTERNVSRRHARLTKSNGTFVVEDLGSYNGVKINGQRIEANTALRSGDRLEIGDYQIDFEDDRLALARTDPAGLSPSYSAPPPRLVMMGGPAPGAEFSLSQPKLRIGRDEQLEIWVNHKSISREHAELRVKDGHVTIFDLDSANGVRVNSEDVARAELQSGDIVEVGEVQFRYVPSQVAHSFDPETTEVDVEIMSEPPAAQRAPVVALLAMLGIILIGGGAVFATLGEWKLPGLTDGDTMAEGLPSSDVDVDNTPVPSPHDSANPSGEPKEPAAEPPLELDPDQKQLMFAAAQEACERALEQARWQDAMRYAEQALTLEPESTQAKGCSERAVAGLDQTDRIAEAKEAFDEGRIDEAFAIAASLPVQSTLRKTPEFREIQNGYVDQHLEAAKKALTARPAAAQQEATHILALEGVRRDQQREAKRILAQARTRLARPRPKPRPTRVAVAPTPAPTPDPPPRSEPEPPPVDVAPTPQPTGGMAVARDCLRKGDNACVIRALDNGQARSASALALLIETHRSMGNALAAQRHMGVFVRRYPNDARAPRYQQILENQ